MVDSRPTDRALRRKLASSFSNQAVALAQLGRLSEAVASYAEATEIREALVRDYPDEPQHASDLAQSYYEMALFRRDENQLEDAAKALHQAAQNMNSW